MPPLPAGVVEEAPPDPDPVAVAGVEAGPDAGEPVGEEVHDASSATLAAATTATRVLVRRCVVGRCAEVTAPP
jgi:hypothetical protein